MSGIEVYRSDTLLVRAIPAADTARWAVAFDNLVDATPLDRAGFGEHFLAAHGHSAIIVVGRGNDWYQYADMVNALAAIRAYLAGATRVITYGSSMGAYAAIRFADRVGAHACLALSPQYSIDPRKAGSDKRWAQRGTAIRWIGALDGRIACACRPVVAYDDRGPDRRHAELIAADTPILALPIPYAGHPAGTYLSSSGLLAPLLRALLDGRLDIARVRREAMRLRHDDSIILAELAKRQPPHRPRIAIAIARRALARAPHTDLTHHVLAERLTQAGAHDEALSLHARAVALSGGDWLFALPHAKALGTSGRFTEAIALANDLAARHEDVAAIHAALARLCWSAGRRGEAVRAITRARRLDPRHRVIRREAVRYRMIVLLGRLHAALTALLRKQPG